MPADYIILAVVAVLGIGGGMFLLREAKNYRARKLNDKHLGAKQPTKD